MNVSVRLSKVPLFLSSCTDISALSLQQHPSVTIRYKDRVCSFELAWIVCECESTFQRQTVGIYLEFEPCAHAISLIVRYAKRNMANWCHLVGLLGTRGLSMVPRHIGVVKINTVTLFGRKRYWTIYYCDYFSLSYLKGPSSIPTGGRRLDWLNITRKHPHVHQQERTLHNDATSSKSYTSSFYSHETTLSKIRKKVKSQRKKNNTISYCNDNILKKTCIEKQSFQKHHIIYCFRWFGVFKWEAWRISMLLVWPFPWKTFIICP